MSPASEKRKTFETLKDAESKGTMNRDDEKNRKDALNPQRQSREIQGEHKNLFRSILVPRTPSSSVRESAIWPLGGGGWMGGGGR